VPPAASRTRRPAVIAHRGGGREVPENTWSAVEHVAVAEWAELVVVAPASADLLARALAHPADLPAGAVLALIGAPCFVLLAKSRSDQ